MSAVAKEYVPTHESRSIEAELDVEHLRNLRTHPKPFHWSSLPNAFKSWYATEGAGWTADIKVDFDFNDGEGNRPKEAGAQRVKMYLARQGFCVRAVRVYATRKGLHLRAWVRCLRVDEVRPLDWEEILQIQEWLNDDPKRRDFNQIRVSHLEEGWNVLWSEKWHSGELISSESFDPEWTATFARWLGAEVDDGGLESVSGDDRPRATAGAHRGSHAQRGDAVERRRAFAHRIAHSPVEDDGPEGDAIRHRRGDRQGGSRALADVVIATARDLLAKLDETGMLIAGEAEEGEVVRTKITALRSALTDLDAAQVEDAVRR